MQAAFGEREVDRAPAGVARDARIAPAFVDGHGEAALREQCREQRADQAGADERDVPSRAFIADRKCRIESGVPAHRSISYPDAAPRSNRAVATTLLDFAHETQTIHAPVVERRRRCSNHIRLAPVDDDADRVEMIEQRTSGFASAAHAQRELAAAALRLARRGDFEHAIESLAQQCFEVAGQCDRLAAQRVHAGAAEDRERNAQRRQCEDRRVGKLPAVRAGRRHEFGTHAKARLLIVTPPAGESRPIAACVTLVHEASGDGAGPGVQIFVAAPDCEIATAVVQAQREIAGRVREIESDDATLAMRGFGDRAKVERLAGAVLHAGQHHERDARAVFVESAQDRRVGNRSVRLIAFELDQRGGRIVSVETDLRFDRVTVGRECVLLDQDRRPLRGRTIEADHHQVQVHGQRIHRDDFVRLRADEGGEVFAHELVVRHPRVLAVEMRLDGEPLPVVELVDQRGAHRARLEAKRIAAEIRLFGAVRALRNQEFVAERGQRIGGVLGERRGFGGGMVVHRRRHASVIVRARLISSSKRRRSRTMRRSDRSSPTECPRSAGAGSARARRRCRRARSCRG